MSLHAQKQWKKETDDQQKQELTAVCVFVQETFTQFKQNQMSEPIRA